MKVLVIPDVHGTHCWEVAKEKINEVDKVVFLGDYFDSWTNEWPDQGENFKNICEFARANPDKVSLNWGNHDWSYMSGTRFGGNCSGHQHNHIGEIRALLTMNKDILNVATEIDDIVFSHAGFTKTWVKDMKQHLHMIFDEYPDDDTGNPGKVWNEEEFSIELLNGIVHELTHTYGDDTFDEEFDELLDWHGFFSGSGDEIMQGPLWVRPSSLLRDAYYPEQVVGHTEYAFWGEPITLVGDGNKIVLTDSAEHNNIFVVDTEEGFYANTLTIPEFNRIYKRIEKAIGDVRSRQPKTMEEIKKYFAECKYDFNEKQSEYIVNKIYSIMENSFEL